MHTTFADTVQKAMSEARKLRDSQVKHVFSSIRTDVVYSYTGLSFAEELSIITQVADRFGYKVFRSKKGNISVRIYNIRLRFIPLPF